MDTGVRRGVDGRWVIVGVVALYFAAVALARAAFGIDLWPFLGVNSAPTLFFDARNVGAAADCWAQGHDPLYENPCDPWGRVIVYPRVWLLFHFLGFTQDRTLLFGAIFVLLFLASLLWLVGRLSLRQGAIVAAAVISPAVMLAIERGNVDILLFAVFVLALFAWQARDRLTPLLSPALIVGAAIAKFYALFALPAYMLTGDRRARWAVPAGVAVMGVYLFLTLDDVRQLMTSPEGGLLYSYGARILIGDLYHRFSPGDWAGGNLLAQAIAVIPLAILAAAVWLWVRRRITPVTVAERMSPRLLAFHLGALTYLGTFAARKNGDYRLVFLLLTLPMLLEWAADGRLDLRNKLARGGVVTVIVGLWVGALSPFIGPWDELGSWAVAGVFVALLSATVPRLPLPRSLRSRRAGTPAGAQTG